MEERQCKVYREKARHDRGPKNKSYNTLLDNDQDILDVACRIISVAPARFQPETNSLRLMGKGEAAGAILGAAVGTAIGVSESKKRDAEAELINVLIETKFQET